MDDYEHKVSNKVRDHVGEPEFPQPELFGVSKEDVDTYLFYKQAILDSLGTERRRYTQAGILIVLPVLVASAFPEDELPYGMLGGLLIALGIGIALAVVVEGVQRLIRKVRLRRLRDENIEMYIDAVLNYNID